MAGLHYRLDWNVLDSYFQFQEVVATPATPETNNLRLYAKDNGSGTTQLCYVNDAGTTVCLPAAGTIITGSGALNRLTYWDSATTIAAVGAITATRLMFADANGLPTGDSDLTFVTDTLTATKIVGSTSITDSGLTATRITFAGTAGLLTDSASLTYSTVGGSGAQPVLLVGRTTGYFAGNAEFNLSPISSAGNSVATLLSYGTGTTAFFRGITARGTVALPTAIQSGDKILELGGLGRAATIFSTDIRASIEYFAGENWTDTANGTYIRLVTTPLLSVIAAERFRVGPSGQWGIGGATFGTATNVFKSGGASAAPTWGTVVASEVTSGAILSAASDTNVTLTAGGSATTALLATASITAGWTGQLSIARGGTSLSAAGHLLNATLWDDVTAGVVARGDVITGQGASAKWARLAKGTANQVLAMDGTATDVAWTTSSAAPHALLDGTANNDTVAQTPSRGSLVYGNSTPKWDELVVGASAGMFLRTDATDAMWSTLILPNAITANNIVYGSATNTYGQSTNLTFDGTDFLLGSGIRARMVGQNRFRYLNSTVSARRTATLTGLTLGAFNTISFNATDDWDTDTLHDTVTNNSRLTAAIAGKYVVSGTVFVTADTGGSLYADVRILANGTTAYGEQLAGYVNTVGNVVTTSALVILAAGEYVEFQATAGGGIGGTFSAAAPCEFQMAYVGE